MSSLKIIAGWIILAVVFGIFFCGIAKAGKGR
ncbi:MAG: hypothetical protein UV48_C0007G0019 [Candidatus Azambacteria bacterium GW2011_GWA2_42_9]|uniref:Uncharacterized protein n=2 Tax=Candidatus Azamiibacteriota TaxID=1752741 RepID=A0A0G1C6L5_9BACT|nr:MAG: hypothetical protein UV10_C0029G0003 [Candidatus Azambacteria bacterium GW2011_GWA1_42_19]KKS75744.1 MAG: hypothetical protein UV48_C0007G0019 [Candidatus Azambacteria bacterium GW2011_GWA2_42_9]KKS86780.1 MAG: hypothetical protein UV62_C0036G0007 [Parcubacteria group bacterium GW2011_GWC1_43_11]